MTQPRPTALDKRIAEVGRRPATLENLFLLEYLEGLRRDAVQAKKKGAPSPGRPMDVSGNEEA